MRRLIGLIILLFLVTSLLGQIRPRDYLIMFDVSGSMIGKGDGRGINIFNDVKRWAKAYIDEVNEGEILAIYPFDSRLKTKPGEYFLKVIRSDADKIAAKQFIDGLKALGQNTFLASSYEAAIQELKKFPELLPNYNRNEREQLILIYTDGKGNERPKDNNLDYFINVYELNKSDYRYLLTKFIFIGDIGVDIEWKDISSLQRHGIEIYQVPRGERPPVIVNVKPAMLEIYDYNPTFALQFMQFPDSLEGTLIELNWDFPDKNGCLFQVKPDKIKLKKNKIFNFIVEMNRTEQCKKFLQTNKIKSLSGNLILINPEGKIRISPPKLKAIYYFKPVTLLFTIANKGEIENKGVVEFNIKGSEYLKETVEIQANVRLLKNSQVQMSVEPKVITIGPDSRSFKIKLQPAEIKKNKEFFKNLNKKRQDQIVIKFNKKNAEDMFQLENPRYRIKYILTPPLNPILFYIIGSILLFLILSYLICQKIRAKFPKGFRLNYKDGRLCGKLEGKFCKPYLNLGCSKKDNIRIISIGLPETLIKIYPLNEKSIKIVKSNGKIKLKDSTGFEKSILYLKIDEFFILEYSGNVVELNLKK